jgi:hypothetical protein
MNINNITRINNSIEEQLKVLPSNVIISHKVITRVNRMINRLPERYANKVKVDVQANSSVCLVWDKGNKLARIYVNKHNYWFTIKLLSNRPNLKNFSWSFLTITQPMLNLIGHYLDTENVV